MKVWKNGSIDSIIIPTYFRYLKLGIGVRR
jgi:hypothetical protein